MFIEQFSLGKVKHFKNTYILKTPEQRISEKNDLEQNSHYLFEPYFHG